MHAMPNDLPPDNARRTAWTLVDPSGKRGGKQLLYTHIELQCCVHSVASGKFGISLNKQPMIAAINE